LRACRDPLAPSSFFSPLPQNRRDLRCQTGAPRAGAAALSEDKDTETMSQTDHRRSRVPLFSWVSAISLGGLLSFVIFLTGADSFDKMMVALDLRSVVHTHEMQSYRFGDLTVSAAEMSVENLDRDGVN
jgi:hypothetical protein